MAVTAGIDFDFLQGRASLESRTTGGASDDALLVLGVDAFFHVTISFRREGYPHRERDNNRGIKFILQRNLCIHPKSFDVVEEIIAYLTTCTAYHRPRFA